jgi:hypothetical protein
VSLASRTLLAYQAVASRIPTGSEKATLILVRLQPGTGVVLGDFSVYPDEGETLILPGTRLFVSKKEDACEWLSASHVCLPTWSRWFVQTPSSVAVRVAQETQNETVHGVFMQHLVLLELHEQLCGITLS